MKYSANKGEWSELYAFFKLLADGKLYSGDGQLNVLENRFYPILSIFRTDNPNRISYIVDSAKKHILIAGNSSEIYIPQSVFLDESKSLLDFIRSIKGSAESYQSLEDFMGRIYIDSVKAKSEDKADIRIKIHDFHTGKEPELGYSIKSRLGGSSTLINSAADSTNFVYSLGKVSSDIVKSFNCLDRFKKKFELLSNFSISPKWIGVGSRTFYNNLMMIDTCLPWIVGECLLYYYSGKAHTLVEAEALLKHDNPLNFDIQSQPKFYEYKLKQFLLAFALGMTPAKSWNGKFNANGGYIVVKEDGDIVCYHFFDRNELEDYLFNNTYFDTPSTKRHNFGDIYSAEQGDLLKLNLQVRFIS